MAPCTHTSFTAEGREGESLHVHNIRVGKDRQKECPKKQAKKNICAPNAADRFCIRTHPDSTLHHLSHIPLMLVDFCSMTSISKAHAKLICSIFCIHLKHMLQHIQQGELAYLLVQNLKHIRMSLA